MNQAQGNMDVWVDATHNDLAGRCGHCCQFCYVSQLRQPAVRAKYSGAPRLHEPAMKQNLGRNKVVFMCDCTDLFAGTVELGMRVDVIDHACRFPYNWYHWRTKSPYGMRSLKYSPKTILGVSLETTHETGMRASGISNAQNPYFRATEFAQLGKVKGDGWSIGYTVLKMVALEPLFKFDLDKMLEWIVLIDPDLVTVGVDSKDTPHPLGEPTANEIILLIKALHNLCDVILKPNLGRILKSVNYKPNENGFDWMLNYGYDHNSRVFRDNATYSQDVKGNRTLVGMNGYEYLDGLQEQRRQKNT